MNRKVLSVGDDQDISIIHDTGKPLWGSLEVGKKSQIGFTIRANRDITGDVYLKWKCPCCADDYCSKESTASKLCFLEDNGRRVDYLKLGPLCAGQSCRVIAEADLTNEELSKESEIVKIGILIFESTEQITPQNINNDTIILKYTAKLEDVRKQLYDEFGQCTMDVFAKSPKNLLLLSLLLFNRLDKEHIDYIVVNKGDSALSGALKLVGYLHGYEHVVAGVDEIKSGNVVFEAASNVIVFCQELTQNTMLDIEYLENEMGCDVVAVIATKKSIFESENDLDIPIEHIISYK